MKRLSLIIFFIMCVLLLTFSACTDKPIKRYSCADPENWSDPKCNPPICLETRICTRDLFPPQYWKKIDLQIFPISYHRIKVQDWIIKGGVEGLTLQQYINAQNLRYIEALRDDNKDLINRLIVDADRVGYYLIPSKFSEGGEQ